MKDPYDSKTVDAFKPQAKTSAERQREYRARKKQRLGYFNKLHGNISKKELIERLIDAEYQRKVNDFPHDLFND